MSEEKLCLRFMLDEGVPLSAGKALEQGGHEVIYFKDSGLAKGSADQLVCITAEKNEAILVAHDGDMRSLAKGHGIKPARFKTLSLLHLECDEANDAARLKDAMSLIEHEWVVGEGRPRRLYVTIGKEVMRTRR